MAESSEQHEQGTPEDRHESPMSLEIQLEDQKMRTERCLWDQVTILENARNNEEALDAITRIEIIHREIEEIYAHLLQCVTDEQSLRLILNERRSTKTKIYRILNDHRIVTQQAQNEQPPVNNDNVDNVVAAITTAFNNMTNRMVDRPRDHDRPKPANTTPIPKPVFDGRTSYDQFAVTFDSVYENQRENKTMKFLRLIECLDGEPKQAVIRIPITDQGYDEARRILQEKYGGAIRDARRILREASSWQMVNPENENALAEFRNFVQSIVTSLENTDAATELNDGTLFQTLCGKLTDDRRERYFAWLLDNTVEPNVKTLLRWLKRLDMVQSSCAEFRRENNNRTNRLVQNRYVAPVHNTSSSYRPHYRSQGPPGSQRVIFQPSSSGQTRPSGPPPRFPPPNRNDNRKYCPNCDSNSHGLPDCRRFANNTVDERWTIARRHQVCFHCLNGRHSSNACSKPRQKCGVNNCQSHHHSLLHKQEDRNNQQNHTGHTQEKNATYKPISFRTVTVYAIANGIKVKCNLVFDECSNRSYISEDLARHLGLDFNPIKNTVEVLNGGSVEMSSDDVKIKLASIDESTSVDIQAKTCPKPVLGDYQPINWSKVSKNFEHLSECKFYPPAQPLQIDILLGANHPKLLTCRKECVGKDDTEPVGRLSPFGWTCIGPYTTENEKCSKPMTHVAESSEVQIIQKTKTVPEDISQPTIAATFKLLFEIETPTKINKMLHVIMRPDQKRVYEDMKQSLKFDGDKYNVKVPWTMPPEKVLFYNRHVAEYHLRILIEHLKKQAPGIFEAYDKVIQDYDNKGYIIEVKDIDETIVQWLLTHFAIIKMGRTSTKVRPVFNGSLAYKGMSINKIIHKGPKLHNDLFIVLLLFRAFIIALACDLSEMYLHIGLYPEDQPFFRFLWKRNGKIITYQFTRIPFGESAAPAQAMLVAREHALKNKERYPLAAEVVLTSSFMDDCLTSCESTDIAKRTYHELNELWKSAGMTTHKWASNSSEVLDIIPPESRAEISECGEPITALTKVLGVVWDPKSDSFIPCVNVPEIEGTLTLSKMLSCVAGLYDPLGGIAPVTLNGRLMVQELQRQKVKYTDPVPEQIEQKFLKWIESLKYANQISIKRCLQPLENVTGTLVIFVDASNTAYGIIAYLHSENGDTVVNRFVCAKARVSPMQGRTIPQLELTACELGSEIALNIVEGLKLNPDDTKFYSDSTTSLHWIMGDGQNFKPYVRSKIMNIQNNSNPESWKYVKTTENPADIVSRGATPKELLENELYYNGPEWMAKPMLEWPENTPPTLSEPLPDQRVRTNAASSDKPKKVDLIEDLLNKSSDYFKTVKTIAWIKRWFVERGNRETMPYITPREFYEAEKSIIIKMQNEHYSAEIKCLKNKKSLPCDSQLQHLRPRIIDGVLRVSGRLRHSERIPFGTRHPFILPPYHKFTRVIANHYHNANLHAGYGQLLSILNRKYWIPKARRILKSVIHKCFTCQRYDNKPHEQEMAPIHPARIDDDYPFKTVGIDLAGPIMTKFGRGKTQQKRWIIVYTCHTTRLAYLDYVTDPSADAFIRSFRRFNARKPLPTKCITDNGGNFVSGAPQLRVIYPEINWDFNPPAAPSFAGIHESVVKLMKNSLYRVLGNNVVTDEILLTVLAEIEHVLNARPLGYKQSEDVDKILTPSDFIFGMTNEYIDPMNLGKSWNTLNEIISQTWDRFVSEYVPMLNALSKWTKSHESIQKDDIVMIISHKTARCAWQLARVTETWPGTDGIVRVANVQLPDGRIMKRPTSKLIKMDLLE